MTTKIGVDTNVGFDTEVIDPLEERLYQTELNSMRLVAAVRVALDKLRAYGHLPAVQWFQYEYMKAICDLRGANEETVLLRSRGLPTLTGYEEVNCDLQTL